MIYSNAVTYPDAGKLMFSTIVLGVVCPMANERSTAVKFVDDVLAQCKQFGFKSVDMFAVLDRASTDGTIALLSSAALSRPDLRVVWAPENETVVDAYVRGYREALAFGCDWILEIDAGYSHHPEDIPQFFIKMVEGYDCVFGSRFMKLGSMRDNPLARRIISRGGSILSNFLLRTKISDMTSGFELFSRLALEQALARGLLSRGPFFQTELKAYCHNMRFAEVPIVYRGANHVIGMGALKDSLSGLWRLCQLKLRGRL
jgi:dolichol-phosphate mannosyltransferase